MSMQMISALVAIGLNVQLCSAFTLYAAAPKEGRIAVQSGHDLWYRVHRPMGLSSVKGAVSEHSISSLPFPVSLVDIFTCVGINVCTVEAYVHLYVCSFVGENGWIDAWIDLYTQTHAQTRMQTRTQIHRQMIDACMYRT